MHLRYLTYWQREDNGIKSITTEHSDVKEARKAVGRLITEAEKLSRGDGEFRRVVFVPVMRG